MLALLLIILVLGFLATVVRGLLSAKRLAKGVTRSRGRTPKGWTR